MWKSHSNFSALKVDFLLLHIFVVFITISSKASFRVNHTSFWNHWKYRDINFFFDKYSITITGLNLFIQDSFCRYFDPFHDTDLFLHPLKTSENLRFSDVSRAYKKRSVALNGLILIMYLSIFLSIYNIVKYLLCHFTCIKIFADTHIIILFQLPGNADGYGIERRKLKVPIDARYIRINPSKWKNGICMRVEFYGCSLSKFCCT